MEHRREDEVYRICQQMLDRGVRKGDWSRMRGRIVITKYKAAQTMTIPKTTCATMVLIENRKSTRPAKNRKTAACRSNGIPSTTALILKFSIPSNRKARIRAVLQIRIQ